MRAGEGPAFLECRTYRFRAHSMFDTQGYRRREEVEQWKTHDPIERLGRWMLDNGHIHAADLTRIDAEIAAELDAAVAYAEAGTPEPVEALERFVLMDSVPQDAPR
jgi:TPP-dependent pyruvate/acetoin dehydrogenase alpha subunit